MSNEIGHEGEVAGARIISKILEDGHAFAEAAEDAGQAAAKDAGKDAAQDAGKANARDLINGGTEFHGPGGRGGNKLPLQGGPPGGVLYKRDPQTGQITNYAIYDQNGNMVRRIDVTGRPHGGVPAPHVQDYDHNVNPNTGQVRVQPRKHVRPALPEEIP